MWITEEPQQHPKISRMRTAASRCASTPHTPVGLGSVTSDNAPTSLTSVGGPEDLRRNGDLQALNPGGAVLRGHPCRRAGGPSDAAPKPHGFTIDGPTASREGC